MLRIRRITLDTESLFTHFHGLGLAEEARLVVAVASQHHRPGANQSPAEVAEAWWSWYHLMRLNIETLRAQRDQDQQTWLANPQDRQAAERLIKSNELLLRAMAGETETN